MPLESPVGARAAGAATFVVGAFSAGLLSTDLNGRAATDRGGDVIEE